jgi:glycosyltransferase involved in cell wall biosynthesis
LAQGFKDSPYEQDKDYLTLVTNNSEWYTTIIAIKNNYSTYKDLSEKAKEYVLNNYNIKSFAEEWTKTITYLCKSQQNTSQK